MPKQLKWEHLKGMLPLLNAREMERQSGLRSRRIADVKDGKSTLTQEELEKIRQTISQFFK